MPKNNIDDNERYVVDMKKLFTGEGSSKPSNFSYVNTCDPFSNKFDDDETINIKISDIAGWVIENGVVYLHNSRKSHECHS